MTVVRRLALILLFVAITLAACGGCRLVEPSRHPVGDQMTVEPQIEWSAKTDGKLQLWTVDGATLAAIYLVSGLEDGEPIFTIRSRGAREVQPTFQGGMTEIEIAEFVTDSLAAAGLQQLELSGLRRARFGMRTGFRFEMTFLSPHGLEGDSLVAGAVVDDKLYLIIYLGARAHYFPYYRDDVERIIESVEITESL